MSATLRTYVFDKFSAIRSSGVLYHVNVSGSIYDIVIYYLTVVYNAFEFEVMFKAHSISRSITLYINMITRNLSQQNNDLIKRTKNL